MDVSFHLDVTTTQASTVVRHTQTLLELLRLYSVVSLSGGNLPNSTICKGKAVPLQRWTGL
jgi:hypothetical protein